MEFIDIKSQQFLIKDDLNKRIENVLSHGKYIMGPEIFELEERLQEFTKAKHCVTVSSGTDALLISLMAMGIKPGDEVITTPFTWVSTVEVIVLLGAIPVFADVEQDTCNINASKIKKLINNKTKAIIPVSLFGQPADMDEINLLAENNSLTVIEDAAQSFGAIYKNKKSCNLSEIGCTSFFPSKPLGCYGDGGAIFTNNDEIAEISRRIRVHGAESKHWFTHIGLGGRMDTLQAAILLAKLDVFTKEIEQRIKVGQRYNKSFDENSISRVKQKDDRTSVFAQYTIFTNNREELVKLLNSKGIPTAVHYIYPVNQSPAYNKFCKGDTPISDDISNKVLSLPMHPYLNKGDQDMIIQSIVSLN